MYCTKTFILALFTASFTFAGPTSFKRDDDNKLPGGESFECGCDYLKDATASDCLKAIAQIDTSDPDATDPGKGINVSLYQSPGTHSPS
jgi:hypothetical protein